jgi:hypothetical protein
VSALIRTRKERGLLLDEIVMLLIHTFSAVGPDQALRYAASEELEVAKKTFAEALLEDCTEIENSWRKFSQYRLLLVIILRLS